MRGDSQIRRLYNTIVVALSHSAQDLTDRGKKEVLDGPNYIRFFSKVWDNFVQDIEGLLASGNYTTIIANLGQWLTGWP